jgi:hypothetical protein
MVRQTSARRVRWTTPISDERQVQFLSLTCDELLTVSFKIPTDVGYQPIYKFIWRNFCAFRNIDEELYLPWSFEESPIDWSFTNTVDDSEWLAELRRGNDLLEVHHANAKHFVILSGDYVTEIISTAEPVIAKY